MFRAFKTVTRYVNGKEKSEVVSIKERVYPPAKTEIVIHDSENNISLRLLQETCSSQGLFIVSFSNGIPADLVSNAETYCDTVNLKNLSSTPEQKTILRHFAYYDSVTSHAFSIYFALLEDCIRRHLNIEDEFLIDHLSTQEIFDFLRQQLGLSVKHEEVQYYINEAEYYSQSSLNREKCLSSANHAIKLISLKSSKNHHDYLQLSRAYACLAKSFSDNEKILQTFNFAKEFFAGGSVDIVSLKEVNYLWHKDGLRYPEHIAMYLHILRLIHDNYRQQALPQSELKHAL